MSAPDFQERLASIERGLPQMADVGGVWPRDVRWLIAELRSATAARNEARRTLGFFASVIKSGEPWTDTCAADYDRAMGRAIPSQESEKV